VIYAVPIIERPDVRPEHGALHYTLATSAGAVEGTLPFPWFFHDLPVAEAASSRYASAAIELIFHW